MVLEFRAEKASISAFHDAIGKRSHSTSMLNIGTPGRINSEESKGWQLYQRPTFFCVVTAIFPATTHVLLVSDWGKAPSAAEIVKGARETLAMQTTVSS